MAAMNATGIVCLPRPWSHHHHDAACRSTITAAHFEEDSRTFRSSVQRKASPPIHDVLLAAASRFSTSALIDIKSKSTISYGELSARVEELSRVFQAKGIRAGDVVVYYGNTSSTFTPLLHFLALSSIGATTAFASPETEGIDLCRACNPSVFITQASSLLRVRDIGIPIIQVRRDGSFVDGASASDEHSHDRHQVCGNNSSAAIFFSSGTTGLPHPVALSHWNLLVQLVQHADARQDETPGTGRHLCALPLGHVYGMNCALLGLFLGHTLVFYGWRSPGAVLDAVEKYAITDMYAVPTILNQLLDFVAATASSLPASLQRIHCGGGKLSQARIDELLKLGPKLVSGYGMTEGGAVTINGELVSGLEAKVMDGSAAVGPGVPGELFLRGENLSPDYIDPAGWLAAGDVVQIDRDGKLLVMERSKDMIKFKETQVSPKELEALLLEHPDVEEAAVVGKKDDLSGEVPVAFVTVTGNNIDGNLIKKVVNAKLPSYKKLTEVRVITEFPKTSLGKIRKGELRKLLH